MGSYPKGLLKLPPDNRDLKLGSIFKRPLPSDLPNEFIVAEPLEIKDQRNTQMCTAYSVCAVREDTEGVPLSPEWFFAQENLLADETGDVPKDLRVACKVAQKIGALERKDAIYSLEVNGVEWVADPSKWPVNLAEKAREHKAESYLSVYGDYESDTFDSLRTALWLNRAERRSVVCGVQWRRDWLNAPSGIIFEEESPVVSNHAIKCFGWKVKNSEPYLMAQLSSGNMVGEKGIFYFSRKVVNRDFLQEFGAFTFKDIDPEHAKKLQDWGIKADYWIWLAKIWVFFATLSILKRQKEQIENSPVIMTPLLPLEPAKYLWNTVLEAKHSSRMIMDDYDLSWAEKDLLCAVIKAESGFNIKAVNKNENGSSDYGICQINDYFWIGKDKYFASVEEVLNQPEKSVRFMCEQFKKGHLDFWVAYTNKSYLRYL